MASLRKIVYMCSDLIKNLSDDSYYTTEHIVYLINTSRALVLKKQYSDIKKEIPLSNYQTIFPGFTEKSNSSEDHAQTNSIVYQSNTEIPITIEITSPIVFNSDKPENHFMLVDIRRFPYIGFNRFLKHFTYCSYGPDKHLFIKSAEQIESLNNKTVGVMGVFYDPIEADALSENPSENILDMNYPIEEALIPQLIDSVSKELGASITLPKDTINNGNDDLSDLQAYVRQNLKERNNAQ